jgi:hypothetical protein
LLESEYTKPGMRVRWRQYSSQNPARQWFGFGEAQACVTFVQDMRYHRATIKAIPSRPLPARPSANRQALPTLNRAERLIRRDTQTRRLPCSPVALATPANLETVSGMFSYAARLRAELAQLSRLHARACPHVESYGGNPVIVYAPEEGRHGNFYAPAYEAIVANPGWFRRFDKIHSHGRSLPKPQIEPARKWRELDSSMSSDALLMNIFCTPGVAESGALRSMLGIAGDTQPEFGWNARVPLRTGRVDRTEVDMRWDTMLVEAKLTESDFQCREAKIVEAYRDLDHVFDRDLLPKVQLRTRRRRAAVEFAEQFTQEWEQPVEGSDEIARAFHAQLESHADAEQPWEPGYASYQLIRNVLAAHATGTSFCVIHDERRPDLREAWFSVMSAVRTAEMRTRCKVLTWQELVPMLPDGLRRFLDAKYGIAEPGSSPTEISCLHQAPGDE